MDFKGKFRGNASILIHFVFWEHISFDSFPSRGLDSIKNKQI